MKTKKRYKVICLVGENVFDVDYFKSFDQAIEFLAFCKGRLDPEHAGSYFLMRDDEVIHE